MAHNGLTYVDARGAVTSNVLAGLKLGDLIRAEAWKISEASNDAVLVLNFSTNYSDARAVIAAIGAAVRASAKEG